MLDCSLIKYSLKLTFQLQYHLRKRATIDTFSETDN